MRKIYKGLKPFCLMKKHILSRILNTLDSRFSSYLCHHNNFFNSFLNRRIYGCDISSDVRIPSSSFFIHYGNGVCVGEGTKIGGDVLIYQNTTIGRKKNKSPVIEDGVIIYPNSVIVGGIKIGKGSVIGAGSFIDKDIPPNSIAYNERGVKIKRLRKKHDYIKETG